MTKLLGAILITAISFFIGVKAAFDLREKGKLLREMINAVELLRCELSARNSFTQIAIKLSDILNGKCSDFFDYIYNNTEKLSELGFSNIWNEAVSESFSDVLSEDELREFRSLGTLISTGEEPERSFLKCVESLERLAIESEKRAFRDGKMYMGMGLTVGLMITIVLI